MNALLRMLAGLAICIVPALNVLAADLKVGMVTSLSGPAASLGIPYEKGLRTGLAHIGEVGGHRVELIVLDDSSDPSAAARAARKLVQEDKVDLLVGAATVPATMAVVGVGRETRTPMIAISPIGLEGPEGAWVVAVVQPVSLMIDAVVDHMKGAGLRSVAYLGFADASGDLFFNALVKSAKAANIEIVADERYARSDMSVTAQALKIIAKHPDAVLDGGTGTPGALPVRALQERHYKGRLYGTHGVINADFIRVAGSAAQGLLAPTGPVIVAEQLPAGNPIRQMSLAFRAAYERVNDVPSTDAFSAYSFDAWLVFADAAARALKGAQPGTPAFREALRDAITSGKEVVGTHGVYNFTPGSRYGVDKRARVMVRLDHGQWKLLP